VHSRAAVQSLHTFAGLLGEVDTPTPTSAFWDRLCAATCRLARVDRALVFVYDDARQDVRAVGSHGMPRELFGSVHVGMAPVAQRALETDTVLVVQAHRGDPGLPREYVDLLELRTVLCTPMSAGGYWYTAGRYGASEHGGTHLDSPIHFGEGKETIDRIPVTKLIGAAAVVDISSACAGNPDYLLTEADITEWERAHGRIPDGAIVLVRTGWGKYWPDRKRYLGSDTAGDTANLHFPGISREAAELLAKGRRIDGVGIDTASIDYGQSRDFIAHQTLNGEDIYGLENIANLDRLPLTGATLIALPMKIKGGTGGPVRIIAILP